MPQVTVGGQTFSYHAGDRGDKWFYHPDGRAKIGFEFEADELYAEGFCDTPDDFVTEDVIEETETPKHDISTWDKDKLADYAFKTFGVKLKKNFSQPNLVKQVEELESNGDIQATD
jgi:hypothetical protein